MRQDFDRGNPFLDLSDYDRDMSESILVFAYHYPQGVSLRDVQYLVHWLDHYRRRPKIHASH